MSRFSRVVSALLVLLISTLTCVLSALNQGTALGKAVEDYPSQAAVVHLSGVPAERSHALLGALGDFTAGTGSAVLRVDQELSEADGSRVGFRIGVVADPRALSEELSLSFMGTELVSRSTLSQLLASAPSQTIGLDSSEADVMAGIPDLQFAPRLTFMHLSTLLETSGTVNGTYRIVGADDSAFSELLGTLERVG